MNKKLLKGLTILFGLGLFASALSTPRLVSANDSTPSGSVVSTSTPITSTPSTSTPITSSSSSVTSTSSTVTSTLVTTTTSEEVIVEYPCKVVLGSHKYGDILYDVEGGNVGDIVTIYAKPYSFYKLTSLKVNDVELTPNEEGNYQFALVEGDNIITATFVIDDEQFSVIAENLANVKDGNWEDIFSIENLFTVISWAITLFLGSGFFVTLLKSKKIELKAKSEATTSTNEQALEAFAKWTNDVLLPKIEKIDLKNDNTEQICKTLTKCFILSQEGTPESRIAIINELTNLNKTKTELTEEVLSIINKEVEDKKKKEQEREKALQELEDTNNNIVVEDDTEGRY